MPRSFDRARSLAARFPTLAAQWHLTRNSPSTPENILASSSTTVWWQCAAGHVWQDKIATRTALPKWKKGDVAACPECAEFPARLVSHTYPGCGHTRTIQRKNAEKDQQRCWECGGDPDPAKNAARLERKRASALASYHRRQERGGPLTDEERGAQRRLVGFVNGAQVELSAAGLTWWRESIAVDIYASTSTEELSDWMTSLGISHAIVLRRSGNRLNAVVATGVHLSIDALDELCRWAPSFVMRVRLAMGQDGREV